MKIRFGDSNEKKSVLDLTPLELELSIPGARHFSLWLVPSQHDHNLLANIINNLANQYNAPVFEPHVTIYTGVYTQKDKLAKIIAGSAEMVHSISLIVKEIGFSDNFFKTLFIEFEDNPVLTILSQKIRSELQYQEQHDLRPHLSLLYKTMCEREKQAIINRLNFTKPQVHLDEITAVIPGNLSQGWVDVEGWKLYFRQKLISFV